MIVAGAIDWASMPTQPIPSNPRFMDLRGRKFGRLTPHAFLGITRKHPMWRCICSCGGVTHVRSRALLDGRQVSCGCHQSEIRGAAQRTHGEAHYPDGLHKQTPEYTAWVMMRGRCQNANDKRYPRYGGRGIRVCARWDSGDGARSGFECFLDDMGRRPSRAHSIDRYPDNNGHYEPGNCRWATFSEQARNRADTIKVVFRGEILALADACDLAGADYRLVSGRMHRGWEFARALSEPKHWRGR